MSLSATEISRVVASLDRDLKGAKLREVISPVRPGRVAMVLRVPGDNQVLQIVAGGRFTRLGRIEEKPRAAERPAPFVMLLRKTLVGMTIDGVRQVNGDRVVELGLCGRGTRHCLVAELTSRHANLFLVDDQGVILGALWPNRSHRRKLVPGEPYTAPFPHSANAPPSDRFDEEGIERRIEALYGAKEIEDDENADAAWTRRLVATAKRRLETLALRIEEDLKKAERTKALGELAHVLKAHLKDVKKGSDLFRALDFEGRPVEIPLDPEKTAVENMTSMFDKARRMARAAADIETRQTRVRSEIAEIQRLDSELDTCDGPGRAAIREALLARFRFLRPGNPRDRRAQPTRKPYKEFVLCKGAVARVGRNARDNDSLTLKHAGPGDLWLHVRGGGGSHVVVPLNRGDDIPEDVLLDAAHLAAHFSSFRKDSVVEVIYTRRRYVQKPRGAPPGSVRLLREKTLSLRVEEARIARLLANDLLGVP